LALSKAVDWRLQFTLEHSSGRKRWA